MPLPTHNPSLPILKAGWTGNPLTPEGRYRNLNGKSERSFAELLRWQRSRNAQKAEKHADSWRFTPAAGEAFFSHKRDGLLWLGHASFLLRTGGKTLLMDPVFLNVGPVKRRTPLPLPATQIRGIDYVLVSHNHRDHADKSSFQQALNQNPEARVLTGLQTGRRLLSRWAPQAQIEEAGWWQSYSTGPELDVIYLPAMHWARRGALDLNDMLWGSFLIRRTSDGASVYFGADSGYDTHFAEIGAAFPGIRLALLGIGAYAPRWFMHSSHTDPDEAVQAMHDLGAAAMVPMHYGTFDLSDEPFGEPFARISAHAAQIPGRIHCVAPGYFLEL